MLSGKAVFQDFSPMFFCTRYYGELLFALYQANGKLKTRAGKQAAKNMLVRNLNGQDMGSLDTIYNNYWRTLCTLQSISL